MKLAKLEELTGIKPFDCGDANLNGFLFEDAYLDAVPFYEKNGFKRLINESEDDTLPMYYNLKELVS
ncbi:MAG: hypothetical protein LUD46_05180 [Parabacteroides sp.]|nr:hypothetical protein [Parabacteroides sp.]